jgi:hypothetical protein
MQNLELDFDKYFFRLFDILRVFLKRIFTRFYLRNEQSCKYCGRDQNIIFSVKDTIWNKLSEKYISSSLCLECFAKLIKDNSINFKDFEIFKFK